MQRSKKTWRRVIFLVEVYFRPVFRVNSVYKTFLAPQNLYFNYKLRKKCFSQSLHGAEEKMLRTRCDRWSSIVWTSWPELSNLRNSRGHTMQYTLRFVSLASFVCGSVNSFDRLQVDSNYWQINIYWNQTRDSRQQIEDFDQRTTFAHAKGRIL